MEWQDISTAPKDGTPDILVASPEGVEIAWWCERVDTWLTRDGSFTWAEPSHWMPLPDAPTE